ncbi:hypothetical protein Q5752_000161 [Cryptotrichosporon argae]
MEPPPAFKLPRRRISYILPAPAEAPPYLELPSQHPARDRSTPVLVPKPGSAQPSAFASRNPFAPAAEAAHPRHCLGVTALALDTTTRLAGANAPGGILYSGGRDGLVASWELHVPHARREVPRYAAARRERVHWERIGDGDWGEDDDEGGDAASDGDGTSPDRDNDAEIAYEDQWEVDRAALANTGAGKTTFRQSIQTHTDWVSALTLCNYDQTVITASADCTIRAWSPHAEVEAAPELVGKHKDYVKALAMARHHSAVFSGSLDRKISAWDVGAPTPDAPVFTIDVDNIDDYGGVGLEGERGSVYALGIDARGTTLAAGTPERVVRLWDPRSGDKSIGKLVGHSDCVRTVIVSEDGRYILTGSSDTTIKLWSLAAHRCLHTFNHHTSSVWALHSTHPNLERFYSGSRDGLLAVADLERCSDIYEGECVVLAREGGGRGDGSSKHGNEGIRAIAALDDEYVWTTTGSAEIHRWKDVGRRLDRIAYDGASAGRGDRPAARLKHDALSTEYASLLRVDSVDSRTVSFAPDATPEPAKSTAAGTGAGAGAPHDPLSLNSIPYESLVCLGLPSDPYTFGFGHQAADARSIRSGTLPVPGERRGSGQIERPPARVAFEDREVASEATPLRTEPDSVIAGRPALVRSALLPDRQHVLTINSLGHVALWNIVRGACVGRFEPQDVCAALADAIDVHPEDILEHVAARIIGKPEIPAWCQVDTNVGSLTVHLEDSRVFNAEVYADELGYEGMEGVRPDARLNLGKWVLTNLFRGLIKAEEHEVRTSQPQPAPAAAPHERPMTSPRHRQRALSFSTTPSINIAGLATPAATPAAVPSLPLAASLPSGGWTGPSRAAGAGALPLPPPLPAVSASPTTAAATPSLASASATAASPAPDYFSARKRESSPSREPTTPGSLMGKLKGFGKKNAKASESAMTPLIETRQEGPDEAKLSDRELAQLEVLDAVRARPFRPPPPAQAPVLDVAPSTALLISEETDEGGAWVVSYRSQVNSTERDMEPLEMHAPGWLLHALFANEAAPASKPASFNVKIRPSKPDMPAFNVSYPRITRFRIISRDLHRSLVASRAAAPPAHGTDPAALVVLADAAGPVAPTSTLSAYRQQKPGGDIEIEYRLV